MNRKTDTHSARRNAGLNLSMLMLSSVMLAGCINLDADLKTIDANVSSDSESNIQTQASPNIEHDVVDHEQVAPLADVLSQVHMCSDTIIIRSQSLSIEQITQGCTMLVAQEKRFHEVFGTEGKPVADDHNIAMRANIYHTRDEYVQHATAHFNMPTNNGGMYLEGYPDKRDNHAEFVAYVKQGQIWNLRHEYVHYLDGRFNKYGDYCNGLHDDHAGPEFCPDPNRGYPHIVWWGEGIAEYVANGNDNPGAIKLASDKRYQLSELFNTSSNTNSGAQRVYRWGYLAVRYMMEQHRDKVDVMLLLVRKGDWDGYQELVRSWGTELDAGFHTWLDTLES